MLRKIVVGAVATLALLAGCEPFNSVQDSTLSSEDMAALREAILSDPLYTSDAAVLNDGDAPDFKTVLGKTTTPIIPILWGRRITSVGRDIIFDQINDTTVVATLTHQWEGTLYILAKYSNDDTASTLIQKPISEQTQRKIKFYKVANSNAAHADTSVRRGWRPAEVSATQGGTENSQVTITRLEIIAGDRTIDITDPLEHFFELPGFARHKMRGEVLNFSPRQALLVRATVLSAEADTGWVTLHRPLMLAVANRPDLIIPVKVRMELVSETQSGSNYERVYEANWETLLRGRHAFFVSAVSRSTLFDDQAPVSVQVWGVPFITQ